MHVFIQYISVVFFIDEKLRNNVKFANSVFIYLLDLDRQSY